MNEMTAYAHRAQRRYLAFMAAGDMRAAKGWGLVVDALFAGKWGEAARRCQEEGFAKEATEILRIFPEGG